MRFGFPRRPFLRSICRYWHLSQWRCQGRFHRATTHTGIYEVCVFSGCIALAFLVVLLPPSFLGGFFLFSGHIVQHPLHGVAADFSQLTSTPTNEILFDRHIVSPREFALSDLCVGRDLPPGSNDSHNCMSMPYCMKLYAADYFLTSLPAIISPSTIYRVEAWLSPGFKVLLYRGLDSSKCGSRNCLYNYHSRHYSHLSQNAADIIVFARSHAS